MAGPGPGTTRPRSTSARPAATWLLLMLLALSLAPAARADNTLSLLVEHTTPIGRSTHYLQETTGPLSVEQAAAARFAGEFRPAKQPVLSFGIGAPPIWLHTRVDNPSSAAATRQLSIDTSWLDRIDIYLRHNGATTARYQLGDRKPYQQRPLASRGFALEHPFEPGITDVFIRVSSIDPMVLPIYLQSPTQALARDRLESYSYGLLYGFLAALLVYNVMLFLGLKVLRYLLYSVYVGSFLLLNVAYTGHGYQWLWPQQVAWTQWAQPTLMILYAVCGLLFALSFLQIRQHFPQIHRAVLISIGMVAALLAVAVLVGNQQASLWLAFTYVTLFTVVMVALGVISMHAGLRAARYFIGAAVCAMIGAALSSLAVWGKIPINTWTYRAVDIGMLLEATLLALALTYQFRLAQQEKAYAQQLARIDPLTRVNNRRAFYDISNPVWNSALRRQRPLACVLLDLDHFKRINDRYGHGVGDEALKAAANAIKNTVRQQDIIARWGGEEFIVLLPETQLFEAARLATRLREAIAAAPLAGRDDSLLLTASLGLAERKPHHNKLEELINAADDCLLKAKARGRNNVVFETVQQNG